MKKNLQSHTIPQFTDKHRRANVQRISPDLRGKIERFKIQSPPKIKNKIPYFRAETGNYFYSGKNFPR